MESGTCNPNERFVSTGYMHVVDSFPVCKVFDHLAQEIHNTAKEKGWYDKGKNEVDYIREELISQFGHVSGCEKVMDAVIKKLKPYDRNDFEMIALEISELAEVIEALRKGNPMSEKIPGFSLAEEETADAIIRMLDRAYKNNYNLGGAILAKMAYNKTRPYRHGGKLA